MGHVLHSNPECPETAIQHYIRRGSPDQENSTRIRPKESHSYRQHGDSPDREFWIQVGFSIRWKCCIQAGDTYVSRQLEGCLQEEERTAHEETEETEETARQVVGISPL